VSPNSESLPSAPGASAQLGIATSFGYRALHRSGALESGVLVADSREQATDQLVARGLFPLDVTPRRQRDRARRMLPVRDLAVGLRVLASLIESGMPISRVLAALDQLVPSSWKPGLPAIRETVRQGGTLGRALASSALGFPPVVVGLIAAGEAGSGLARAVRRAADLTDAAAETQRAIRSVLAYPLVLACAGGMSLLLLVGVVLPRFAVILADLGQELPPLARGVLVGAAAIRIAWLPALLLVTAAVGGWHVWIEREEGARRWAEFLLQLPVLGSARHAVATSRIAASLSALLENGVPIAPAMASAAWASGDAAVAERLLRARQAVVAGEAVGRAIESASALTPTAIRLLRAGEQSGQVALLLSHAGRIEGERATELVKASVRLLEPGLIVVFGGLIAVVAGALLQAIYSVRPGP
jgi:general secretion pathway protein F